MYLQSFFFAVLAVMYFYTWRMEARKSVVITPFVFSVYFLWIRFYPNFLIGESTGITINSQPFFIGTTVVTLFLVGYLIGAYIKPTNSNYTQKIGFRLYLERDRRDEYDAAMLGLGLLLIVVSLYFFRGIPETLKAVVLQLRFGAAEYLSTAFSDARFHQTKSAYFGGESTGQGLLVSMMKLGWPMVTSYFIVRYIDSRSPKLFLYAITFFFLGFVFILSIGSRGPSLIYIMMLIASYSVFRAVKLRTLIASSLFIVFLAVIVGSFSTRMDYLWLDPGAHSLKRATIEITERIFIGNVSNDIRVIDLVNNGYWQLQWGGNNLRNIINAIPGIQYGMPLAYELFVEFNPGTNASGFYTGTYLSIIYSDFGFWGIAFAYPLIGIFVGTVQRVYFSIKGINPYLLTSAAGSVFYSTANFLTMGFSGASATIATYIILILALFTFKAFGRIRRIASTP